MPVGASALEAIKSPFTNFREFVKFACIPIAITLPFQLLTRMLSSHSLKRSAAFASLILLLVQLVASVPLSVAWIRLTLNGARSVSRRGLFPFGGVERRYLLASIILVVVFLFLVICAGVAISVGVVSYRRGQLALSAALILSGILLIVTLIFVFLRSIILFVEIALQRYAGLRASWRLGKGVGVRQLAVLLLSILPFLLVQIVVDAAQAGFSRSLWVTFPAVASVLVFYLSNAVGAAIYAIIYRFQTCRPL